MAFLRSVGIGQTLVITLTFNEVKSLNLLTNMELAEGMSVELRFAGVFEGSLVTEIVVRNQWFIASIVRRRSATIIGSRVLIGGRFGGNLKSPPYSEEAVRWRN